MPVLTRTIWDEAHRFAVASDRLLRRKKVVGGKDEGERLATKRD